jgi:hypothetical protein
MDSKIDLGSLWNSSKALIKQINDDEDEQREKLYKDQLVENKLDKYFKVLGDARTMVFPPSMTPEEINGITDECDALRQACNEDQRIKADHDLLAVLSDTFMKAMEGIKSFMLIQKASRIYTFILLNSEICIDWTQADMLGTDLSTMPVKVNINPRFIKDDVSIVTFIGDLFNLLIKLFYIHPLYFVKMNSLGDPDVHRALVAASDCASSTVITAHIMNPEESSGDKKFLLRVPKDIYTVSNLMEDTHKNVATEKDISYYYEIYRAYMRRQRQEGNSGNSGSNNKSGNSQSQSQSQDSQNGQPGNNNNQQQRTGHGQASPNNNLGHPGNQWDTKKEESSRLTVNLNSTLSKAISSLLDSSKTRGEIPGYILEQIEFLSKPPKIDWRDRFRRFIGVIPTPYRKSRLRQNRIQPERMDLSGRLPNYKIRVVCVMDTSGSVSDDELTEFLSEIQNMMKQYNTEITIVECDAAVTRHYVLKPGEYRKIKTNPTGRGGTAFTPAIEWINYHHRFKDAMMVYFTDGFGDNSIPKPNTFRNLWVVLDSAKNLSVENPYGPVIALPREDIDEEIKNKNGGYYGI